MNQTEKDLMAGKVWNHLGNEYPCENRMAEHYGLTGVAYRKRRKYGWTLEECLAGRPKA